MNRKDTKAHTLDKLLNYKAMHTPYMHARIYTALLNSLVVMFPEVAISSLTRHVPNSEGDAVGHKCIIHQ